MKPDNAERNVEEEVRMALSERAVIWDRGLSTACHPDGGYHSLPCEGAFEGEIFRGSLSGCQLIVDRVESKGKASFMASIITHGRLMKPPRRGRLWN
jgi:hypothetical protein